MKSQRGGFFLGMVVGLLIGLAVSLGVALYISKVPIPFVNKVPQRTAEQDAAEIERNKNWDPNSSLSSKVPVRPSGSASGVVAPVPGVLPPGSAPAEAATTPSAPSSTRDPAAILAGQPVQPAQPAVPAGLSGSGADPFSYFVQAGAYTRMEEADQQRARLAMMGLTARITEREQTGRTVYRVRVGPFDNRDSVTPVKEKLDAANIESAIVRVQK